MDKRTILAVAISVAVLILWQVFFTPAPPPPPPPGELLANKPAPEAKAPAPFVPKAAPPVEEKTVRVETDLYIAEFSSRGGTLKSFQLKRFQDKDGLNIVLLKDRGAFPALGIGRKGDFTISNENFALEGGDLKLSSSAPQGTLVFSRAGPDFSIRRTYTFRYDSYGFDLRDEVSGLPEYELTLGTGFGLSMQKDGVHIGPVVLKDSDRVELTGKKLKKGEMTFAGGLKWIAMEDKYFFSALVPRQEMKEARAWAFQDSEVLSLRGSAGVNDFMVYAGPKEHERLKGLGVGLEHIIDFGFFSIIARPLFWFLKFLYRFIGNYGWAIVVLTIVVRIPFIPIVNRGQRAMKKLQEVQPRMQELREKYKKDPQRLQKETMELYRKYKVNPMSGCLPMLLQIPVFFALYKVLLIAIELRGAPFMLWITDLSQKDPYYITPIVMGITMVIQQKMTPSAGDPRQQKLMMFMPVIFTFMFLSFASGLVLYWLVNNLLSIAQQFYVNKKARG